ncbi:MAG: serine/threonine protein kinase [Thermoanaerobaculia bacterium]
MDQPDSPVFDEKFEFLGKLGEGGMGAIYKVRHRLLNQILVIKMMTPKSEASPDLHKRFLREAQTATRLRHPSIVSIFDFVLREDGTAYMVMEYLEGANLADALRRCGPMPVSLMLLIADQVLSAMDFMHEKGAIHRDIAPDNIMLTREETGLVRAKLIDLGIAKILNAEEDLSVKNEFIGKLRYSSPEQFRPRDSAGTISGRTDVYSFGAVAYELITGVKAIRGNNILAVIHAHQTGQIVPFAESDPRGDVSPELREVLLRAMSVNPDDRFATAEEFRHALTSMLAGNPLDDPAVRSYIQAVLSLSPDDSLLVEGRPRSGTGASPGGTRPRSTPDASRVKTAATVRSVPKSGGQESGAVSPELSYEIERTKRTSPQVEVASPVPQTSRRSWLVTLALLGGVVVVAGAAVLLWLGRSRPATRRGDEALVRSPQPTAVIPTPVATAAGLSSPPVPMATLEPRVTPGFTAAPTLVPVSDRKPTLVAQVLNTPRTERAVPTRVAAGDQPHPANTRFCPLLDATYYQQGVVKERPKGFASESGEFFRRARDDAGRIQIRLSVTPKEPADGDSFQIVGDVVNGGDLGLVIERVEESSVSASEGYQKVGGLRLPLEIPSGGAVRIYTYHGVVSGRSPFMKELRIVDSRADSWKTAIRFRACPGP